MLKFSAGYDWKHYQFTTTELRRSNGTTANLEATVPAGAAAIPIASYSRLLTFGGDGLGLPAGNATTWLVPDLSVAATLLSLYDQTAFGGAFRLGPEPALGNNNGVEEGDNGGFVQADLNTTLFGHALRGNLGVRYVQTRQTATGFSFVSGSAVPVTTKRTYTDTLPSLNIAFSLTDNLLLRFAAARTMSRPNLGNLAPGNTINVSGATRTGTAGNPNLDPFRATAIDLAAEWYFGHGSLLSVAYFYKDLDSFVQTVNLTGVTFTGNPFGLPDSLATAACGATPGCSPSLNNWTFSTPRNTSGGVIQGFEVNYQQPFTFLPGLLSHTGAQLNFTYVSSSIDYVNSAGAVVATNDLTGLSRRSWNATLYYEDDHISTRVSAAYRSNYLTRIPGQEAGTDADGTNSTLNIDASFAYSFNRHFRLTLEGINLTDEFQDQFNDSSNRVSFYHHTGREFLFGARYTY
jgi:iron complex outermembrane receptor protein